MSTSNHPAGGLAASKQLIVETRTPIPAKPGKPAHVGIIDTPKHGSWLDMAESELGVLASQCLDRRIDDQRTLAPK